MGGSHGGFSVAATQRRLQLDAELRGRWPVSGSFIHAAPLDVSGRMAEALLADAPYYHPSYLLLVVKAFEVYAPGAMPDSNRSVLRHAFRAVYDTQLDGSSSVAQLDEVWRLRETAVPSGMPLC